VLIESKVMVARTDLTDLVWCAGSDLAKLLDLRQFSPMEACFLTFRASFSMWKWPL
jgi:hypothetical protein